MKFCDTDSGNSFASGELNYFILNWAFIFSLGNVFKKKKNIYIM